MTADALKKITTDALDTLAALLDQGLSDQLTALLKTMARFHTYSWHNICLIASQCPTATRVAGFQTWRTMGRFVRKGEKGIAIMAPIICRREAAPAPDDTNARTVVGFRAAYVFDVEQTEGEPLPAPSEASGDPGISTAALKRAIVERGITLESFDDLGGALGTSSGGCIRLLNGLSPATEFTTLVHEYAHELLHHADDRPASRDTRELEAEAVAFVVGGAVGLDTADTSRDYIHLYRGDREALASSLTRIQRAASMILAAVDGAQRRIAPRRSADRCPAFRSPSVGGGPRRPPARRLILRSRPYSRIGDGARLAKRSRMEYAGLAGLPLNCPHCGQPMRYLHARTPSGQTLPANAPPPDSTIYVYACSQHGAVLLGPTTPFQRKP